jgi:hypothetical protein
VKPRIPVLAASLALIAAAVGGPVAAQSPGVEQSPDAGAQAPGAQAPGVGDQPHPAHIHVGACPEPGDVAFPLNDVVSPSDETVGAGTAIPVEVSSTVVEAALTDIVGGQHAINVHESAEALDAYIACGDVGGPMLGTADLAIGLAEQNGSGHHGVAWLHDNGDGTTRVDVILLTGSMPGTPGASEAPGASMAPVQSMAPAPGATTEPGGTTQPGGTEPAGTTAP